MSLGSAALRLSIFAALLGSALAALAATPAAKVENRSGETARLFRDIKADAAQIQSAANRLEGLTRSSGATWLNYDRQWNEIKPPAEDMEMKLSRLEQLQPAISPAARKQVDQAKATIEQIQRRTHQLRALLDTPGVLTNDAKFKTYGRSLKIEAGQLERAAAISS